MVKFRYLEANCPPYTQNFPTEKVPPTIHEVDTPLRLRRECRSLPQPSVGKSSPLDIKRPRAGVEFMVHDPTDRGLWPQTKPA